jgi:hypothetical protein
MSAIETSQQKFMKAASRGGFHGWPSLTVRGLVLGPGPWSRNSSEQCGAPEHLQAAAQALEAFLRYRDLAIPNQFQGGVASCDQ